MEIVCIFESSVWCWIYDRNSRTGSLQSFIQANPNIGVTDNAGDGILTFLLFFALFFLQMPRYNVIRQEAEKKLNVGG